jgi:hypothetical protein
VLDLLAAKRVRATLFCSAGSPSATSTARSRRGHGSRRTVSTTARDDLHAETFRASQWCAAAAITAACGVVPKVLGAVAVARENLWVRRAAREGYFPGSVFPVRHDRYGIPDRAILVLTGADGAL